MKNIAILVSGSGTNAEAIIKYFAVKRTANVAIVISDTADAFALTRAQRLGIKTAVIARREFRIGDSAMVVLRSHKIDLVVLAGFLSLVPRKIIEAFPDRILNIHPALLPKFGGKGMYGHHVHEAVVAAHESITGITIHLVNEHYDSGSTIAQFTTPVTAEDTPDTVAAKIHILEQENFARVIETQIERIEREDKAKRLLMISNSTRAGHPYLEYCIDDIGRFLDGIRQIVFVPYAAVTFSYDEYEAKVQAKFDKFGIKVHSVHRDADPVQTVMNAEAICVGGGNTFSLVSKMHAEGLIEAIRTKINAGTPYVGWSAGSNVCCPTLCTTNDMPIVEPSSFATFAVIPFQINPHYLDTHPEGHAGETREQRILEYIEANDGMNVVGLREGCMLTLSDGRLTLRGERPMRLFHKGCEPRELTSDDDLTSILL